METNRSEQRARFAAIGLVFLVITSSALTIRNWPESFSHLHRNRQYLTNSDGYIREAFPADPADFIELVGFEGRMFNENHYAGYLIWRFSPEPHKVFSDPRFDIFGSDIFYLETIVITAYEGDPEYNVPSWEQVLDEWKINWMIIKQGTKLSKQLSTENQGWVLVADWSLLGHPLPWQIWIRDTPENEELIQRSLRSFHRRRGVAPS